MRFTDFEEWTQNPRDLDNMITKSLYNGDRDLPIHCDILNHQENTLAANLPAKRTNHLPTNPKNHEPAGREPGGRERYVGDTWSRRGRDVGATSAPRTWSRRGRDVGET